MKKINDGGPAFPCVDGGANYLQEGMSLRDYFAAKAMQGLLTNFGYEENGYAQSAYKIADAMLAAREAGK
jgi:hypothetical protein